MKTGTNKRKVPRMLIRSILPLILLFVPFILKAQVIDDEYYAKAVEFMQGKGVIEEWFTEKFIPLFKDYMKDEWASLISIGQAIAGLASLLYLGNIGWQMAAGERNWDVMPMLRPFAIALVLANWVPFTEIISSPVQAITEFAQDGFHEKQVNLAATRMVRYKKQQQLIDVVFEERARIMAEMKQQEAANEVMAENGLDIIGDGIDNLMEKFYETALRLQISIQIIVAGFLESVGLIVLRVCVYTIFFIQLIFSSILIITGPIAIGMSVFPMFASSFSTWVARFININLYQFMAYIVMQVGALLQTFAYEAEIDRYNQMIFEDGTVKSEALIMAFSGSGMFSFTMVIVCFIISGIGVLCVPTLANYVVSAGSNAGMLSKAKSAGNTIRNQFK